MKLNNFSQTQNVGSMHWTISSFQFFFFQVKMFHDRSLLPVFSGDFSVNLLFCLLKYVGNLFESG